MPVKNLFDYLEGGDDLDEFLDDFSTVQRERALAVLQWCRETLESQALDTTSSDGFKTDYT